MAKLNHDHTSHPPHDNTGSGSSRPDPQRTRTPAGQETGASSSGRRFVVGVILLGVLITGGSGGWALVAPESFADYTQFAPYNEHFAHDIGAFLLGIGSALLASLVWRDARAVVLVGFLVANTTHAFNHWIDLDLGGRDRDPWVFFTVSLLTLVALIVHVRLLKRQSAYPSTADEPTDHR